MVWSALRASKDDALLQCGLRPLGYERVDPFCIIDPACVSPLYRSGYDGVEDWTGVNGWSLPGGQMPAPGDRILAIPNYIAYMLVVLVGIVGVRK